MSSRQYDWKKQSLHVHSDFCDGDDSASEIAKTAYENDAQILGISSHSFVKDDSGCMAENAFKEYCECINRLKSEYNGKMSVLLGIEWDSLSDESLLKMCDYTIGSVHCVLGEKSLALCPVDLSRECFVKSVKNEFDDDVTAFIKAYYDRAIFTARKKPDIMGHFDLIKKFNLHNGLFDEESKEYVKTALEALECVDRDSTILEVNTSAVVKGLQKEPYPSAFLLKYWCEKGGRIVITSDAHKKKNLFAGYDTAAEFAKHCGFNETCVLTQDGFINVKI